jgi:GntR family transcriptional repressor for pyruvate dehydrogenase complex
MARSPDPSRGRDPDAAIVNTSSKRDALKVPLRIARAIARQVASERLPPGTMLEPEQEMARRFGVGRPSVREALRLLETQGLIVIRRGVKGGPVVAAPSAEDLGKTITMFLQMTSTPLRAVILAGAELEGLLASMAAERVHEQGVSVDPLRQALEREHDVVDRDERLFAGIDFHHQLHVLAGNEVLRLLTDSIGGIVAGRTRAYRHDHWEIDEQRDAFRDHVELFDAIERGDPVKAALLSREHMLRQAEHDLEVHPDLADAIVDWG